MLVLEKDLGLVDLVKMSDPEIINPNKHDINLNERVTAQSLFEILVGLFAYCRQNKRKGI